MGSLFDRAVERIAEDSVRTYFASPEFKSRLSKHIGWMIQGFAPHYGLKQREAFTQTVADRIREKARRPIYLFGYRLWRARETEEFATKEAERIVTDFLRDEKVEFGHPDYDWKDGRDLADDDMSYWEACP